MDIRSPLAAENAKLKQQLEVAQREIAELKQANTNLKRQLLAQAVSLRLPSGPSGSHQAAASSSDQAASTASAVASPASQASVAAAYHLRQFAFKPQIIDSDGIVRIIKALRSPPDGKDLEWNGVELEFNDIPKAVAFKQRFELFLKQDPDCPLQILEGRCRTIAGNIHFNYEIKHDHRKVKYNGEKLSVESESAMILKELRRHINCTVAEDFVHIEVDSTRDDWGVYETMKQSDLEKSFPNRAVRSISPSG